MEEDSLRLTLTTLLEQELFSTYIHPDERLQYRLLELLLPVLQQYDLDPQSWVSALPQQYRDLLHAAQEEESDFFTWLVRHIKREAQHTAQSRGGGEIWLSDGYAALNADPFLNYLLPHVAAPVETYHIELDGATYIETLEEDTFAGLYLYLTDSFCHKRGYSLTALSPVYPDGEVQFYSWDPDSYQDREGMIGRYILPPLQPPAYCATVYAEGKEYVASIPSLSLISGVKKLAQWMGVSLSSLLEVRTTAGEIVLL